YRIPLRTRTGIVGAEGDGRDGRVAAVRTASLDADGAPIPGTERRIEADTVGVGWGFVPQLDLLLPLGCDLADA
ncbi:FAD/NAD(P)-binding oxidoreductase, partial [Streptomyces parvus]|nr:FAD/NAD(P)-binding oxidoreductase [Streptomyces parvus]